MKVGQESKKKIEKEGYDEEDEKNERIKKKTGYYAGQR